MSLTESCNPAKWTIVNVREIELDPALVSAVDYVPPEPTSRLSQGACAGVAAAKIRIVPLPVVKVASVRPTTMSPRRTFRAAEAHPD